LQIKIGSTFVVIALLVLASGSQFLKQAWLASGFGPGVYAGWATAILASQLLYNFGGLGYHNFSARHAAVYKSREKKLITNRLVSRQYLIYAYLLPISIPVIYYLVAKPSFILFGVMMVYALANVFLNTATTPIYVRSSLESAKIQSVRGVGGTAVAVLICYATGSLLLTLLSETVLICVLGFLILKREKFTFKRRFLKLDLRYKELVPFFVPVLVSTLAFSLSRLIAIDFFNEELLGIYYFMFLIASAGMIFQYGVSVIVGPMIVSQLNIRSEFSMKYFVLKIWIVLFLLSLLVFVLGQISLPYLINYFYPNYVAGLVLAISFLCLSVAKMCDVWSVYYLLAGLEKYLYVPSLVSILIAIGLYFYLSQTPDLELADMRYFIFGESIAIFLVPLLLLPFIKIKRLVRA